MTDPTSFKLEVVAPVMTVVSMEEALRCYRDLLLFNVAFEWSDTEQEPTRYTILQQGNTELHLSAAETPHPTVAYIFVGNVQAYHDAVKARGANISEAIQDHPWEMREFEVTDPDGNRIIFGEHLSRIDNKAT